MSVALSQCRTKILPGITLPRLSLLAVIAVSMGALSAWGAVPAVVIDSQQTVGNYFNNPQSLTVNGTNQGAIFITDTNNNQMIALLNDYNYVFQPGRLKLRSPQAVVLDSKGNLFIGDTPLVHGVAVGRITKIPADNTGNLTNGGEVVFEGAPLTNPTALAVDSAGNLFIGDFPPSGAGAIYTLAANAKVPTPLAITNGPPSQWFPSALLRDSTGNLYFTDNGNLQGSNGNVYVVAATGGAAAAVPTPGFVIDQPTGLSLNAAGDLAIPTLLDTGAGPQQQVLIIPAASPSTPYILPSTGINTTSGLVFDANNKLDIADSFNGDIVQLSYGSPTNFGSVNLGKNGPEVTFNFEFNQSTTLSGFRVVTQGDTSTDLTQISGGTCQNGPHTNLSAATPYTCTGAYQATPAYPGVRTSSIVVAGPNNTILASTPVYQIGFAGAEVTYPLTATATATNLQQPQGVVITGDNNTVYVADTQAGKVYSMAGLTGSVATPVSTGSIALQSPIALAIDGVGDLYIADYSLGELVEVPANSGAAPSIINTGGLLQHPIAVTVDNLGNLYIGDGGPAGFAASSSNPGYVVKLPVGGGAAFKMPIPTVSIVFPQALTTDFYTNNLYVGDGGDLSGVGQVDVVLPDSSAAGAITLAGITNPTALTFDPAGNLYILDGTANTISGLSVYLPNAVPYPVTFAGAAALSAPSAMAMSAGGQSFVVTNIGSGTSNNLVYLNGNSANLAFGDVAAGVKSDALTATEYNIGNMSLTLGTPYYSATPTNSAFSILASSSCKNNSTLNVGGSCTINAQFAPASSEQTTQQIKVNSTAYNSGVPVLILQGTGVAAAVAKPNKAPAKSNKRR